MSQSNFFSCFEFFLSPHVRRIQLIIRRRCCRSCCHYAIRLFLRVSHLWISGNDFHLMIFTGVSCVCIWCADIFIGPCVIQPTSSSYCFFVFYYYFVCRMLQNSTFGVIMFNRAIISSHRITVQCTVQRSFTSFGSFPRNKLISYGTHQLIQ